MPEWANMGIECGFHYLYVGIKMMISPLVFTSLVMGIIGIGDIAKTGKVGLYTLLWYTGTTALVSGLGLVLPRMLHLGKNVHIVTTKTQVEGKRHLMDCWILYRILFHKSSGSFRIRKYTLSISFCGNYWTCMFGCSGKGGSIY